MCITPIKMQRDGANYTFPCGKCPKCSARRISGWSFRLMQQDKKATSSYFITLTYDSVHIPITKKGYMGLDKSHVQKFFKRLRKSHEQKGCFMVNRTPNPSIKYYAVGEYGGKSSRPHYHIIIFNCTLELMMSAGDLLELQRRKFDGKHQIDLFDWTLGKATVGTVSGASVGYTMKYVSKTSRIPLHCNDDRIPQFALMSKSLVRRISQKL